MTSTVLIDGQPVQITNGDRENARAWFLYSSSDSADASLALEETPMEYIGLNDSIDRVRECLTTHCNKEDDVCAILGFSQGATFCHILSILASAAAKKQSNNNPNNLKLYPFSKIHCAILLSGFPSMHNGPLLGENLATATRNAGVAASKKNAEAAAQGHNNYANNKLIELPSLHIFGEKDTSVPKSYGEKLATLFDNPDSYDHGKGHVIPHNAALCERVISFLDSCVDVFREGRESPPIDSLE